MKSMVLKNSNYVKIGTDNKFTILPN